MLFDFRLLRSAVVHCTGLQVVQLYFLAGQKVRLCRRGSLAGPGVVLGYDGDSRLIVLDNLRVHVSLIDRTKRFVKLYRDLSTCTLSTGRYFYPLFLISFAQTLEFRASQQLQLSGATTQLKIGRDPGGQLGPEL